MNTTKSSRLGRKGINSFSVAMTVVVLTAQVNGGVLNMAGEPCNVKSDCLSSWEFCDYSLA